MKGAPSGGQVSHLFCLAHFPGDSWTLPSLPETCLFAWCVHGRAMPRQWWAPCPAQGCGCTCSHFGSKELCQTLSSSQRDPEWCRVRVIRAKRLVWFSVVITVFFRRLPMMTKLAGNSKRYNMLLTYDKARGEEMKWKWVRSGRPGLKQFPVVPGSI